MAAVLPATGLLYHGKGEGQAWLLLEARICRSEIGTGARWFDQPRYRARCRIEGWRLRQQPGSARSQVQRNLQGRKRGNNSLLAPVAGRSREDPTDGSARFYWPVY